MQPHALMTSRTCLESVCVQNGDNIAGQSSCMYHGDCAVSADMHSRGLLCSVCNHMQLILGSNDITFGLSAERGFQSVVCGA